METLTARGHLSPAAKFESFPNQGLEELLRVCG